MANKKLIIGMAAAAAALAATAIVIYRKRSSRLQYEEQVEEAKENFKSKLDDLQRKAKKHYKNSPEEAKDAIANATHRAERTAGA